MQLVTGIFLGQSDENNGIFMARKISDETSFLSRGSFLDPITPATITYENFDLGDDNTESITYTGHIKTMIWSSDYGSETIRPSYSNIESKISININIYNSSDMTFYGYIYDEESNFTVVPVNPIRPYTTNILGP